VNSVTGDPPPPASGSLTLDLGARVPVGLPCTLTWIYAMCLRVGLGGESSTTKILVRSSSSSSAIPSPRSPCPDDKNPKGRGKGPNHGWRKVVPSVSSEK
jgi:hypothetical protein